jgi:adenylyltransferase/sulfurtransferase
VDLSNLQRQVLHSTADVGRPKTESALEHVRSLNPEIQVELHPNRVQASNVMGLLQSYDLVIDGTDNLPTRYLVNDACVLLKKPNVYGAVYRFEGQASVLAPHLGGPCYRCLYPEMPPAGAVPSCAEGGVLGVVPGIIGCLQASETLKLILGAGTSLVGRLLLFNALEARFREIKVRRDPRCPVCGYQPTITQPVEYAATCAATPPATGDEVSVQDLQRVLTDPLLGIRVIDVREPSECQIARLPGTLNIPLGTLPARLNELDPARPYYLHCKGGVRSLKAVALLKERGFREVKSVRGGILAWSSEIDPTVPKY